MRTQLLNFPNALSVFGRADWADFFDVADAPQDIKMTAAILPAHTATGRQARAFAGCSGSEFGERAFTALRAEAIRKTCGLLLVLDPRSQSGRESRHKWLAIRSSACPSSWCVPVALPWSARRVVEVFQAASSARRIRRKHTGTSACTSLVKASVGKSIDAVQARWSSLGQSAIV
jgi:hypothetical protein